MPHHPFPRLFLVGALLLARAAAGAGSGEAAERCERVEFEATHMTCDDAGCELHDEARLKCPDLSVWADEITIVKDPETGDFLEAEARGNVLVVEGSSLATCQRVLIGPDRIRGQMMAADVHAKRLPPRPPSELPEGRDAAHVRGNVKRTGKDTLEVRDAVFTVCDCGEDPPPWTLEAHHIDVTLKDRAIAWWPVLWIRPFGLFPMPVTPPLPVFSVPLKERAFGLLMPELIFVEDWPIVDLPIFIPIGDSWDVVAKPGLHMGWGAHRIAPVSAWGSPRLGVRLRYAPHVATSGEFEGQWTWDRKFVRARRAEIIETMRRRNQERAAAPAMERELTPMPPPYDKKNPSWDLAHRVALRWRHRTDFLDNLHLTLGSEWLSDDLYLDDFRMGLQERAATYIPSRAQLLWRRPGVVGVAAADFFQEMQGGATPSNAWGSERYTEHRGPALRLALMPTQLAGPVYADATLSFSRYGPWAPELAASLLASGATGGISYLGRHGPLQLEARAGFDNLWLQTRRGGSGTSTMLLLDGSAETTVVGRVLGVIHAITPRLVMRSVPWDREALPRDLPPVDERVVHAPFPAADALPTPERTRFYQGILTLDQALWTRQRGRLHKIVGLRLSQPIDLSSGDLLESVAEIDWAIGRYTRGTFRIASDLYERQRAMELSGNLSAAYGPVSVSAAYLRLSPDADSFRRGYYALAAPPIPRGSAMQAGWVHAIQGSITVSWKTWLQASYGTAYLLPVPTAKKRREFSQHTVTIRYQSPCECWGVGVQAILPAEDPWKNRQFRPTFSIAGYSVTAQ